MVAKRTTYQEVITERQLDIIRGSLLGDGYLPKLRSENHLPWFSCTSSRPEYATWKYAELANLCTRGISTRRRKDGRSGKEHTAYDVSTACHPQLRGWRETWYPQGIKVVPEDVIQWLTPLCIAVWFMDDGYRENDGRHGNKVYHGRRYFFSTDAFSKFDRHRLVVAFVQRYKLYPEFRAISEKKYRLAFNRQDSQKLAEIMRPHMIPVFEYKFDIFSPDVRCND